MSTVTTTRKQTEVPAVRGSRDPLSVLREEMNDLISRFWNGGGTSILEGAFAPALDVSETDNLFEIRMDAPGMEAKNFEIQVRGNTVSIGGQRKEESEEKGKTYHRVERRSGSFSRTVTLPCKINEDEVAAEYREGVLCVKLPKCEEAKAKKIAVKT